MRPPCLTVVVLIGLISARSWATGQDSASQGSIPQGSTPQGSIPQGSTPTISKLYYLRMQSKLNSRANIRTINPGTVKPPVAKPPVLKPLPKAPVHQVPPSRPMTITVVRKFEPQMQRYHSSTFLVLSKALVGHPSRRASYRIHTAPDRPEGRAVRVELDDSVQRQSQHQRMEASRSGHDQQKLSQTASPAPGRAGEAPSTFMRLQLQFELLQMGDSLQQ